MNSKRTETTRPADVAPEQLTQQAIVLTMLLATPGQWIEARQLAKAARTSTISDVAFKLRRKGHNVENKKRGPHQLQRSYYRIVLPSEGGAA